MSTKRNHREFEADLEMGKIFKVGDKLGLPPETYKEISKRFIKVIENGAIQEIKDQRDAYQIKNAAARAEILLHKQTIDGLIKERDQMIEDQCQCKTCEKHRSREVFP